MNKTGPWITIVVAMMAVVCAILYCLPATPAAPAAPAAAQASPGAIGIFEGRTDIGEVVHPGVAEYDAASKTYTLTAAGENMWSTKDAFYFLRTQVSGDVELSADVAFPHQGGRPHRKAALVLKQNLDADGVYADAALHGSGLPALQYRRAKGATRFTTSSFDRTTTAPSRVGKTAFEERKPDTSPPCENIGISPIAPRDNPSA